MILIMGSLSKPVRTRLLIDLHILSSVSILVVLSFFHSVRINLLFVYLTFPGIRIYFDLVIIIHCSKETLVGLLFLSNWPASCYSGKGLFGVHFFISKWHVFRKLLRIRREEPYLLSPNDRL